MNSKWVVIAVIGVGGIMCGYLGQVWAEALGSSTSVKPYSQQVSTPDAPVKMSVEDARRLVEYLRGKRLDSKAKGVDQQRAVSPPKAGISRTIRVEPPEVVNKSSKFRFHDVTDRSVPIQPRLTLEQRRKVVDMYRKSLLRDK